MSKRQQRCEARRRLSANPNVERSHAYPSLAARRPAVGDRPAHAVWLFALIRISTNRKVRGLSVSSLSQTRQKTGSVRDVTRNRD
jgi:hypothetical protein